MVERILEYFHTSKGKSPQTPFIPGIDFFYDDGMKSTDHTPYRQVVGSLGHLANTVGRVMYQYYEWITLHTICTNQARRCRSHENFC